MAKYYYLFLNPTDPGPADIQLADKKPSPQYVTFNNGEFVDWISKYHSDGVLFDIVKPIIPDPVPPVKSIEQLKIEKLNEVDNWTSAAYVGGFYSSASGTKMYYDSDKETQALLSNIYQRTKETDWTTKIRYPGIAPAGKAPIRARPLASDPETAKDVQLLDAAQLKTLIDDLDDAFFAIKTRGWQLQAAVAAAETVAAVEAIIWAE